MGFSTRIQFPGKPQTTLSKEVSNSNDFEEKTVSLWGYTSRLMRSWVDYCASMPAAVISGELWRRGEPRVHVGSVGIDNSMTLIGGNKDGGNSSDGSEHQILSTPSEAAVSAYYRANSSYLVSVDCSQAWKCSYSCHQTENLQVEPNKAHPSRNSSHLMTQYPPRNSHPIQSIPNPWSFPRRISAKPPL
jgi:hypothetical protein